MPEKMPEKISEKMPATVDELLDSIEPMKYLGENLSVEKKIQKSNENLSGNLKKNTLLNPTESAKVDNDNNAGCGYGCMVCIVCIILAILNLYYSKSFGSLAVWLLVVGIVICYINDRSSENQKNEEIEEEEEEEADSADEKILVFLRHAKEHFSNKDYDKALFACTKALARDPENVKTYLLRADIYETRFTYAIEDSTTEDLIEADKDYIRAIGLKPQNALRYYKKREKLYQKFVEARISNRALQACNKMINRNPNNVQEYLLRAYVFELRAESDEGSENDLINADKDYTQVIEMEPNQASHYQKRGQLYQKLGLPEAAEADFAMARSLEAKEVEEHENQ